MSETVLDISQVSKRFGTTLANDNISLSLARGEIIALLGENGAGKTTLMSMLFGHYTPDSGHISVMGRVLPPGRPGLQSAPASAWCISISRWPQTFPCWKM